MAAPTSGGQAAKQNGTAKTSGRRRHVATAAGAARYKKPIGSEIGGPRDANHAAIQQDQGARKNYGDLIGGDPAKQRAALDGMSTEDLNKLADISFSFKSANPQVVALRIAARNAQARRGIRIKPGQTQTNPGKAAPSVNYNNRGATKALANLDPASRRLIELTAATAQKNTSSLGNFPIPDVAHLRKAISAIGRAKPEHRPLIARHIIARASKLNASHLVSDHIKHYARGHRQPGTIGMAREDADEVELAGHWKHGYIPLDAAAMESKMKGRTGGKRWWGDSTHGGVSGNLKPHGSPKSGTPKPKTATGLSDSQIRSRINRGEGATQAERNQLRGGQSGRNIGSESNPAARHKMMEQGRQARIRQGVASPQDHATERAAQQLKAITGKPSPPAHGGSQKLTKMVKSGSADSRPRGAGMTPNQRIKRNQAQAQKLADASGDQTSVGRHLDRLNRETAPKAAFSRATMIKRAKENGLTQAEAEKWADNPNRGTLLGKTELGPSRTPKPGEKQDTTGKSKLTFTPIDPITRKPTAPSQVAPDQSKKEATIANRIASGKGKTTTGVLSAAQKAEVEKLQAAGKHDQAGALSRKHLDASKARIAKMVAASKASGSAKASAPAKGSVTKHPATESGAVAAVRESMVLPGNNGEWAGMADIRDRMGGTREQQDAILKKMSRDGTLYIVPEDNSKVLSDRERAAAIRIGGDDNHVVTILKKGN